MGMVTHATRGFPMVRIASQNGGRPVEVCLVAQLGPGGGDRLCASATGQQRGHGSFVDALQEPSAKLFASDIARGDATSLYSFAVGAGGHPFHRHAGHRVFTAISGSGGAQLRFSTLPDTALRDDPQAFRDSLRCVDVPPDCLFAVRFGGGTWHQFAARDGGRGGHPAFFALSCHTDELGGIEDPALAQAVRSGRADIPTLTELLPSEVQRAMDAQPWEALRVPTTTLTLHAAPESLPLRLCAWVRNHAGRLRGALAREGSPAFVATCLQRSARVLAHAPERSLLAAQFTDRHDHEDIVALTLPATEARGAAELLADVLAGFLDNRPQSVSWLMQLRNVLVRPLRLRTSPLGCPVSSLLAPDAPARFAGRFPVLAKRIDGDRHAEVLLGADDRHLAFRSVVGVERQADGTLQVWLGTRVRCRNAFGRFYMAAIEGVHRRHVAPTMLEMAVAHALLEPRDAPALLAVAG